jgi:hypothetical protein
MARQNGASRSRRARCVAAGVMIGMGCLSAACGRDGPLGTEAARPPDGPSRLLNPLCTSSGTSHPADSISTSVTWSASGNPHQVTGTVALLPGGTLTIQPGAVVCFPPGTGVQSTGGRLVAKGLGTAPIVFTAYDPAQGWAGVDLQGTPGNPSQLIHARVEYVALNSVAVASAGHRVFIDTSVVRQSGAAVSLWGRSSRFLQSRVDTTTNRYVPAVTLGDSARFVRSVILRAAGTGLLIDGTVSVSVNGGRIEESGGTGIRAPHETGISSAIPAVRVVGGLSYPIETTASLLQRLYGSTAAEQDSLKGNARDTVVMLGGVLNHVLYVRSGLPWHVKGGITLLSGGVLAGQGGSRLVLDTAVYVTAAAGGRIQLRGAPGNPVVVTADDPARGWLGFSLYGTPATQSYITNAVVEYSAHHYRAVDADAMHRIRLDSVVLRQNGSAVRMMAPGSRLVRTRVDTTTWTVPAVELGADAVLESTLIRGSSGIGLWIDAATVQVVSCEVRESAVWGIFLYAPAPVHNCNLVDNLQVGVWNNDTSTMTDATNNWWGDAAGPFGPNGDGASFYTTYTPWRTTPYVLPYVP